MFWPVKIKLCKIIFTINHTILKFENFKQLNILLDLYKEMTIEIMSEKINFENTEIISSN